MLTEEWLLLLGRLLLTKACVPLIGCRSSEASGLVGHGLHRRLEENIKIFMNQNHLQHCIIILFCFPVRWYEGDAAAYFHYTYKVGYLHSPCCLQLVLDGMHGDECADSYTLVWRLHEGTDLRWGCQGPSLPPSLAEGVGKKIKDDIL